MRKMMKRVFENKHTKKSHQTILEYVKEEFQDKDGYYNIDIDLSSLETIYNPLSFGKQKELSEDIFSFIESKANLIPIGFPLKFTFHGKEFDDKEKLEIKRLILEHFQNELYDKDYDRRKNTGVVVTLTIIGIAFLSAFFTLSFSNIGIKGEVFSEILSIIGSFSLWEATDYFLLGQGDVSAKILELKQLMEAEIAFE